MLIYLLCWFRVQGSGFRVQGSGFKVQGSRFKVQRFRGSEGSIDDCQLMIVKEIIDDRQRYFL